MNYACAFSQSELGKYFEWIIMPIKWPHIGSGPHNLAYITFIGYRNNRSPAPHTDPYISKVTLRCRWSYFKLGSPVHYWKTKFPPSLSSRCSSTLSQGYPDLKSDPGIKWGYVLPSSAVEELTVRLRLMLVPWSVCLEGKMVVTSSSTKCVS